MRSLAMHAEINLHVVLLYGENRHHMHEAIFKSLGIALYTAFSYDSAFEGNVPSTKGIIV